MYGSLAPNVNQRYAKTAFQGLKKLADKVVYTSGCLDKECNTLDTKAIKDVTTGVEMVFVCLGTSTSSSQY